LKLAADGTRAIWSTRFGGSAVTAATEVEVGLSVVLLPNGDLSVIGVAFSPDFPTVAGAAQGQSTGVPDYFIARLNASATTLLRSTLLGGSAGDGPGHGHVVLADGSVIVGGATSSPAIAGAIGVRRGPNDALVAKLNPTGTAFEFIRLLGGSGTDRVLGPVVDGQGRIYVAGGTNSVDIPVTADALQPTYGGGPQDGVLFVLNPDGTVHYASYLGGAGTDLIRAVAVSPLGDIYLVGGTDSNNFPTTVGAHKTQRSGIDGFVVKLVPR
jgi:hypothetical protein